MSKYLIKFFAILLLGGSFYAQAETFWYCVKDRPAVRDIAKPMLPEVNELPQKGYIGSVSSSNAVTCTKLNISAGSDFKSQPNSGDGMRGSWELSNNGRTVQLKISSVSNQDPTRQFGGLGTDQFLYVGGFTPTTIPVGGKPKQVFLLKKEGIVPFVPDVTRGASNNSSGSFTYQLSQ